MSFLTEYQLEIDTLRNRMRQQGRIHHESRKLHFMSLTPVLKRAYRYFSALSLLCNDTEPAVSVSYECRGVGKIDGLKQAGYRARRHDSDLLTEFGFSFIARFTDPESSIALSKLVDRIGGVNSSGAHSRAPLLSIERTRDWSELDWLRFAGVSGFIPVCFQFKADPQRELIQLKVSNFTGLGSTVHPLQPELITTAFLDELAKYVVRRPNRFEELTGNVVPEGTRSELRRKVQESQRQRERSAAAQKPTLLR